MDYRQAISLITPLSESAMSEARMRWDDIAKPLHSLGILEDMLVKIAGMTGRAQLSPLKKALIVMCADNGVVSEGVTQTGQEVTAIVAENFLSKKTSAALMCEQAGVDIYPIDVGMITDTRVPSMKTACGSQNIAKGSAMTREEAISAIEAGILTVFDLKEKGYNIFATGEMGIGNTTTSSAIASVMLECPPSVVTGRGAGLDSAGLARKISVIERAIKINAPEKKDPIDVLSKVGGFDIAGLVGVFLGSAACHLPVVIDGFISCTAALLASGIAPACKSYMLPSHVSKEPAAQMLLDALGFEAPLHCGMSLGEGTGAVALFPLIELAMSVYDNMTTFGENSIEAYVPLA